MNAARSAVVTTVVVVARDEIVVGVDVEVVGCADPELPQPARANPPSRMITKVRRRVASGSRMTNRTGCHRIGPGQNVSPGPTGVSGSPKRAAARCQRRGYWLTLRARRRWRTQTISPTPMEMATTEASPRATGPVAGKMPGRAREWWRPRGRAPKHGERSLRSPRASRTEAHLHRLRVRARCDVRRMRHRSRFFVARVGHRR